MSGNIKLPSARSIAGAREGLTRLQTLWGGPAENYFWVRKLREVVLLYERNLGAFQEGGLFIELGCGKAREIWFIDEVLRQKNIRMVGTEVVPKSLEYCQDLREKLAMPQVTFEPVDVTLPLPWQPNSVDIIYASEVFEHIKEIEALITSLHTILKPGGFLAFTTPNEPNVFQPSYYGIRRNRGSALNTGEPIAFTDDGRPLYGHVSVKTNRQWDALLDEQGFDLADYGRGAIWYGAYKFQNHKWFFPLQYTLESCLDFLPRRWTRNLSDGVIALYRKCG